MTNPPQGSDEQPHSGPPSPSPGYGPPGAYPASRPYGPPTYGQAPPPHGPPAPAPYPVPSGYGQPQPSAAPPQAAPPYGAPAYGAPYGPPPAPPAQKSKIGLIAIATAVALAVIAGVVVLVMSLQSTVLDPSAVERDVAAQFEQREGVAIDLDCGDTMTVRAGATYTCTGRTADGESVTLTIAITDPRTAAYTWTEP